MGSAWADRIPSGGLRRKVMSAEDAAALIPEGASVGMSGFTSAGYPKALPSALADRIGAARANGHPFPDFAVIEAVGFTSDGDLIPSSSVGNNKTWIDQAGKVIVEVNAAQSREFDGMHDIYYGTALPPLRTPIPLTRPGDRIGVPHLICPANKFVAIVQKRSPGFPRRPRRLFRARTRDIMG
jgi:acyl-CoA hydrolase